VCFSERCLLNIRSVSIALVFAALVVCFPETALALQASSDNSQTNYGGDSKESDMEGEGFFRRLAHVYCHDWSGESANASPPPSRNPAPPLQSPPFPNADWPYGGSPIIGAPDSNVYPLMKALGKEHSRVKVYGWIEPGLNFSTSRHSVYPMSYNIYANRLELDQAVLYVERLPDTVQTDHADWGFHFTTFYGVDYRFTTAKGYFSQQLLLFNRQYGFDPVLEYFDVYVPYVVEGMNIRIGRYISVPGIEAQLATSNYAYTHSLLFTTDPFTQSGVLATVKLNQQWVVQAGIQAGNDVAPWVSDAKPSLTACVSDTFHKSNDNIYLCANGINSGRYAYNNVQHFDLTWYHKLSTSLHLASEAWYMYERDVPNIAGNVGNPIPPEVGANGAFCAAGQLRCFAPEWAAMNYVEKQLSPHDYLSIRNEVEGDIKGQRTGYKNFYSEHEIMWGHWIGSTLLFRPGLRFDRAYQRPAYDNGTEQNQFSFTLDLILKF
jgi:hypothetical protein